MVLPRLRRDAGDPRGRQGPCHGDRGCHRPRLPTGLTGVAMLIAILIIAVVAVLLVVLSGYKAIRIIPQARARNVERFGRYTRTLEPGKNWFVPRVARG